MQFWGSSGTPLYPNQILSTAPGGGGLLWSGCDGGVRAEPWTHYPSSEVILRKSGTHG